MQTIIRIALGLFALSGGYIWTVGQSGLTNTNQNLCDLVNSLSPVAFDGCRVQVWIAALWAVLSVVAATYLLFVGARGALRMARGSGPLSSPNPSMPQAPTPSVTTVSLRDDICSEANAVGAKIFALTATYQPQMPVTNPKYQALNAGIHADNAAAEKVVVAKYLTDLSGEVRRIGERAKAQGFLSENDAWMISQRPAVVRAIEEFGAILFRIGTPPSGGVDKPINMHEAFKLICGLRRLDGATDPKAEGRIKVFPDIRQLARDGKLVIRGRPIPKGMHDSTSPQENIPAEHWRHYDFEETVYMTDDDERNVRFASTSINYANRLSIDRYNDLSVNEREIYRLFGSAS